MAITDEDIITDLKQFISAELQAGLTGAENRLDNLKKDIDELKQGLADVDTKVDTILETIGEDVVELQDTSKNHEKRIVKLETKAA